MASHATTSEAAPACQARQQRLLTAGIGAKFKFGKDRRRKAY
ncbi:MAG: hypothetical protein JWR40_4590, partial [Massilia sp.]|nr:hypothetical protein [Massilia sp.]